MSKQLIDQGAQLRTLYRSYVRWLNGGAYNQGKMAVETTFMQAVEPFSTLFFDAYGVLYGGATQQQGVADAMQHLRDQGKTIRLLSNNGHESLPSIQQKLAQRHVHFEISELITSGMVVSDYLQRSTLRNTPYLLIGSAQSRAAYAPNPDQLERPPGDNRLAQSPPRSLLVCSDSLYWDTPYQPHVEAIMSRQSLPMLVANPDMVVPLPDGGWMPVAGHAALDLNQRHGAPFIGLGKPFSPVFEKALASVPHVPLEEIVMIGDTPETDILGGNRMGLKTCLVGSGTLAHMDLSWRDYCAEQSILPDFFVPAVSP
ncbi:HAD-IIA family hydrolase [Magnetococcus sp. PR-3]|uniref:HAD-IIA family hydrolase n=1 Tax=Magnetococcus sp. PR-3 TaxID=3120355 RepID=UPI002FCE5971